MKVSVHSEPEIARFLSRALVLKLPESKCKQMLLEGIYNAHLLPVAT